MKRRDFFKGSAAGLILGSSVSPSLSFAEAGKGKGKDDLGIKSYRELGRTKLKISDISLGGGKLNSPSFIARAVGYGINYVDTAPDYGPSQATIGRYLAKSKDKNLIVATKFCNTTPYPGHLSIKAKKDLYTESVDNSLKTLKRDYVDIVFVHAIGEMNGNETGRLLSEEMLSAYDNLKKAGKVRFLAVSSHGPKDMEALLTKAIDSGHYDLIMPAFNFMKFPKLSDVIKNAASKNVGVIAMKTLAGAKDMNIKLEGEIFERAAFKWVLKHPEIAGLIVTMNNQETLEKYIKASGQPFSKVSEKLLDIYRQKYTASYCRTGCGDCLGSCPSNINLPEVFRQHMYYSNYGMQKKAMLAYAKMGVDIDAACGGCETRGCDLGCSYNLPVSSLLKKADEDLRFNV